MFVEVNDRFRMTKTYRTCNSLGIMQKTHLIECVRQQPCIWDTNHESFRSTNARQAAFNEIAQMLSDQQNRYTRSQMQDEWGKIRYCFTRIIKKFLTTEDEAEAISWPYWEKMQFMYEIIKDHLLSRGSPREVTSRSTDFYKQMKSFRGRTRLRSQRFTPSTPSGLSPNSLVANNFLAAINNPKHITYPPTQTSVIAAEAESQPKSVFDLGNSEDKLLTETKQEGEEDGSCLVKRLRTGEDHQKDWVDATRQYLSSLDSLPTSSNGVSSSSIAPSTSQTGDIATSTKGMRQHTLSAGEIVSNTIALEENTSVESGEKEVDTSEYFVCSPGSVLSNAASLGSTLLKKAGEKSL